MPGIARRGLVGLRRAGDGAERQRGVGDIDAGIFTYPRASRFPGLLRIGDVVAETRDGASAEFFHPHAVVEVLDELARLDELQFLTGRRGARAETRARFELIAEARLQFRRPCVAETPRHEQTAVPRALPVLLDLLRDFHLERVLALRRGAAGRSLDVGNRGHDPARQVVLLLLFLGQVQALLIFGGRLRERLPSALGDFLEYETRERVDGNPVGDSLRGAVLIEPVNLAEPDDFSGGGPGFLYLH